MNKLLTLAIPTYNSERVLPRLLRSLADQDYSKCIVFVSDDGSSDATRSLIQAFAAEHPGVVSYESHENIGIGPTRNRMLDGIESPYVWFIDHDDEIRPGCLAKLVQVLDRVWNHWAGATNAHANEVLHYIGRVKPWSPTKQIHGPIALWWAYYAHYVKPLLPPRLRLAKEHDWHALSRVPILKKLIVSMPHLVNVVVGVSRLGRRSAQQRRDDLAYLIAKRDEFRSRFLWMDEFRKAAHAVKSEATRVWSREAVQAAGGEGEAHG